MELRECGGAGDGVAGVFDYVSFCGDWFGVDAGFSGPIPSARAGGIHKRERGTHGFRLFFPALPTDAISHSYSYLCQSSGYRFWRPFTGALSLGARYGGHFAFRAFVWALLGMGLCALGLAAVAYLRDRAGGEDLLWNAAPAVPKTFS